MTVTGGKRTGDDLSLPSRALVEALHHPLKPWRGHEFVFEHNNLSNHQRGGGYLVGR